MTVGELTVDELTFYHILSWLVPSNHLMPKSFENHLDAVGIEPRSLASFPLQATALSIAPWPLGQLLILVILENCHKIY